jgi:hypothetical protein
MSSLTDYGALHGKPPLRPPAADPHLFQRVGDTIEMPKDVAKGHPLYGVAGWLVTLAVFMVLDALVFLLDTIVSFILASRGAGGWYGVLGLIHLGLLAWSIACIAKLFQRRADFPSQFTALCIASATLSVISMLIAGLTWLALVQLAAIAIFFGYVQRSRRVRVTYLHQVDGADPYLDRLFPQGLPDHLTPAPSPWRRIGKFGAPARQAAPAGRRPF